MSVIGNPGPADGMRERMARDLEDLAFPRLTGSEGEGRIRDRLSRRLRALGSLIERRRQRPLVLEVRDESEDY